MPASRRLQGRAGQEGPEPLVPGQHRLQQAKALQEGFMQTPWFGAAKVVQQVKVPAAWPDDLSLIRRGEGENLQVAP